MDWQSGNRTQGNMCSLYSECVFQLSAIHLEEIRYVNEMC